MATLNGPSGEGRDPRSTGRRRLTPRRPGPIVWYVVALLVVLAVSQFVFSPDEGRQISYSELKHAVREIGRAHV